MTGGPASGKTTVARALAARGPRVLSADEEARAVVEPGGPCYEEVVALLGPEVVGADGRLDRAAVAARVFDPGAAVERPGGRVVTDLLLALEGIIHPVVRERLARGVAALEREGVREVVLEVPLLFEAGMQDEVDCAVTVFVPDEVMLRRLMERGLTEREALARIRAQMPLARKAELADHVVRGDLPRAELDAAVAAILEAQR